MSNKSYIGHFLYNQYTNTIYKYELAAPDTLEFYYSEMLKKEVKRNKTLHKDIMTEDDLKHCRGRIFYFKDTGYTIVVGHWIYDYPKAVKQIIDTFNLPCSANILIHKHWDKNNNKELK